MDSIYQQRPWLTPYPNGSAHDLDIAAHTAIGDFLKSAESHPDAPAVYYFDQSISYGDVDRWSDSLAAAFHDMGLRAGDRIIVDLQNVPQFLIAVYAAWKLGAIVVPLNPMYKEKELAYFCMDSGAKLFLTLDEIARNLDLSFLKGTRIENIITTSALDFLNPDSPRPEILKSCTKSAVQGCRDLREILDEYKEKRVDVHESTPDSVAYLTYTSGTTGQPKGAMNTQGNTRFQRPGLQDHDAHGQH